MYSSGSFHDSLLEVDEVILAVDDFVQIADILQAYLEHRQLKTLTAASVAELRQVLKEARVALVLLDINLPDGCGVDVIPEIKENDPDTAIIMLSGVTDLQTALKCIRYGADDYLTKPVQFDPFWETVRKVLEKRRLKISNRRYQKQLEQTNSRLMTRLDGINYSLPSLGTPQTEYLEDDEVILSVDDFVQIADIIPAYLHHRGLRTLTAASIAELRQVLKKAHVALVLLDINLPDTSTSGVDLIPEIKEVNRDTAIIMLSGVTDLQTALKCIRLGADDYLTKPVQFDPFWETVRKVLEKRRLRINNRHYKQQLEQANLFLRQLLQRSQSSWQPLSNGNPPSWASGWGQDKRGIWLEFTLDGENGPVTQRLRWIPPGSFLMGSPENEAGRFAAEGPQHQVKISKGFWIFDSPVTQALWQAIMDRNPSRLQHPDHPVELVSWNDCQHFLRKINQRLPGLALALPSEAQWEYACRSDSTAAFYAESIQTIAWQQANSGGATHPVRQKQPNAWGLHDMLGNVWEWTADTWHENYQEAPADGSLLEPEQPGHNRVIRGGSWRDEARFCRCAYRSSNAPDHLADNIGFRCLCVLQ